MPQRRAIKQRAEPSSPPLSARLRLLAYSQSQSAPKCVRGANKVQGVRRGKDERAGAKNGATFRKWRPIRSSDSTLTGEELRRRSPDDGVCRVSSAAAGNERSSHAIANAFPNFKFTSMKLRRRRRGGGRRAADFDQSLPPDSILPHLLVVRVQFAESE